MPCEGEIKRTPMVAANWKMNGRRAMADQLVSSVACGVPEGVSVVVCPPFPYLERAGQQIGQSHIELGAQNVSAEQDGAFTGEVSAEMLTDCNVRYVIVGHSERRALFNESSACVAEKFLRAQQAGLIPILCVGETLHERESDQTRQVIKAQLQPVFDLVGAGAFGKAVIAYEPVWAIGTGMSATHEQAQEIHAWIRAQVGQVDKDSANSLRILYGGSVKPDNAPSLFAEPDIDGGLIGGASLNADDFLAICQAAKL